MSNTARNVPAPPPHAAHAGNLRAIERLRLVATVALVAPVLLFLVIAAALYRQQFDDVRQNLETHARVMQEQALKLLETNEMLLQRMADLVEGLSDAQVLERSAALHQRLKAMAEPLHQVQGLFINGADGRGLVNTLAFPVNRSIDYSDRAWFRAHRAGTPGAYVSELLSSRVSGELFFDLSRRRTFADGSFAGTLNVSLRPAYFVEFYKELSAADPALRMILLRDDGSLLATWPSRFEVGTKLPADNGLMAPIRAGNARGLLEFASPFDGSERLAAYRKLGAYPLYVSVGMDRASVLAAWMRQIGLLALFLVPTSLAFAAMAWSALQRTRRQFEALRRLEDEVVHRHRIETALLTAQKLEAMGRLTGGVAHDFNNLLMILNTTLYLHKKLHPQFAEDRQLAAMERAIASGTKLTRQLLAFARKQALRPERTELAARLPELLVLIKPVVGSLVDVDCEVAPGTGAIEVDAAELELAMINLAVNARDAMQGAGRLSIRARNVADGERPPNVEGELVMIEVVDSGSGIDAVSAQRLFEPFFTTKPVGQGTGLGLSQVQTLCQSTGGVATIDNAPGGGARVRLYFSLSTARAPAAHQEPTRAKAPECDVLLVEDNDAVADSTAELLRAIGCRVERVASAQEALARLDESRAGVDVVLSDIEMPGPLDGVALAQLLSRRQPPMPVVLMTGYAARLEQAVAEGLDVLPKPCSPDMLSAAIGRAQQPRQPLKVA